MLDKALRQGVRWSCIDYGIGGMIWFGGRSLQVSASQQFVGIVSHKAMIHWSHTGVRTPTFPWIVGSSTINVVGIFRIKGVLELFSLFKIELFFMLEAYENRPRAKKKKIRIVTVGIATHSLLNNLLISPVLIAWFSEETCGRLRRAKIMNAFIGRLGVPSALSVWDVKAVLASSEGKSFF